MSRYVSKPNEQLYAIITEKLQSDPNVDQDQLEAHVQAKVAEDSQLAAALSQSMLQINLGDTTGFQTLVSGGIAYIGPQVRASNAQLEALLEHLLQRLRPIGIPENLPLSGANEFVGRDDDLQKLHTQLHRVDRPTITSIRGMGGIGKTELALQYARSHYQQGTYPGGICWLRAHDQDIATQIVSFAKVILGLTLPDEWNLTEKVSYCWRNWTAGDVLVIIDDVTDYGAVKDYLPPQEPRFWVLLTTRLQLGTSIQTFAIQVLTAAASQQLLVSLVTAERIAAEAETAKALCEWLGCLPLGLELVGRYLAGKLDLSLADMQEQLEGKRLEAQALRRQQQQQDMTAAHESAAAAFELSWTKLDKSAQELCYLLSLFSFAPIDWKWVERCFPDCDANDLESLRDEQLLKFSLLQREEKRIYLLHQLIREFFQAKLCEASAKATKAKINKLKKSICSVLAETARTVPQIPTLNNINQLAPVIPHLIKSVTKDLINFYEDQDLYWSFTGVAWFYAGQGLYSQAEPWYEACMGATSARLSEKHPYVANSLNNMALLYSAQGRYNEAEPLYQKALSLRKLLWGEEHLDVASSANDLAELYNDQGSYKNAESLYQQALAIRKLLWSEGHPDVATSLNNLATLYNDQGRYKEAESHYQQALEMYERLLGENHLDVATTLNNLAALYSNLGHYDRAERFYKKALKIYKQLLGEKHPDVARSFSNLAALYSNLGHYDRAERFYKKALKIYKQLLGEKLSDNHPTIALVLNNLGALYNNQNRYERAELFYQKALEMYKRLFDNEHPNVARSLSNLAGLYNNQRRYEEAKGYYSEALAMYKRLLGEKHPDVAHSLENLAGIYSVQNRFDLAKPRYQEALEIYKQLLGEVHPKTIKVLHNLRWLRYDNGDE